MNADSTVIYRTYIEGFDDALDGGIPQKHIVLISGMPGTMKSSLGYYILFHNAVQGGIPGAYITLEQSKESLIFQMNRLGLKGADEKKLLVIDMATIRKKAEVDETSSWLDILLGYLRYLRDSAKIELLVLDSLQALKVIAEMGESRSKMFRLFEGIRDLGITAFLISEVKHGISPETSAEEYLADGIIALSLVKVGSYDFHRRIRCVKMRGMHHLMSYYSLDYKKGRFIARRPV